MRVIKYFGVAWQSIQAHRMRAILTMLGIIIGIAAVLVTVGIGSGTAASITERIESSGTNLLTVSSGMRGSTSSTLTMADAEVLGNTSDFPSIIGLAPQYSSQTTVANGASQWHVPGRGYKRRLCHDPQPDDLRRFFLAG